MYTLYFDGLFRRLPGKSTGDTKTGLMSCGWLIFRNHTQIARGQCAYASRQSATSNTAEYLALIEGLEALLDFGVRGEPVTVFGDSKCVIDQMKGLANISAGYMRRLHQRAARLARSFSEVDWVWTPRGNNKPADALTRHALRQVHLELPNYEEMLASLNHKSFKGETFLPLLNVCVYQPKGYISTGRNCLAIRA
jgi:ribonuclease HI